MSIMDEINKQKCRIGIHKWNDWNYESRNSCIKISTCQICGKQGKKKPIHDWGELEFESPTNCRLIKCCNRCKEVKQYLPKHTPSDWQYQSNHECIKVKKCQRCNEVWESKIEHKWLEGKPYIPKDSYLQTNADLRNLFIVLKKFSTAEIRELCFGTGGDYEDLSGEIKTDKVISMIKQAVEDNRFIQFITLIPSIIKDMSNSDIEIVNNVLNHQKNQQIKFSKHFNWHLPANSTCAQVRICGRCLATEEYDKHNWGDWKYISNDDCFQTRYCRDCGIMSEAKEVHIWTKQDYKSPNSCEMIQICSRCHENQSLGVKDHEWQTVPDKLDPSKLITICSRCKEAKRTGLF